MRYIKLGNTGLDVSPIANTAVSNGNSRNRPLSDSVQALVTGGSDSFRHVEAIDIAIA